MKCIWLAFLAITTVLETAASRSLLQNYVESPTLPAGSPEGLPPGTPAEVIFPTPAYLLAGQAADNIVVEWNRALQWGLAQEGVTNLAPRLYAFMHDAMFQAWKINNAARPPADTAAVIGYAAMATLKSFVPAAFFRYNQLYTQQTANLTQTEIKYAATVAGAPVADFLASRLNDGFNDLYQVAPDTAPYGEFVRVPRTTPELPVTQYANTSSLVLPADLSEIEWYANFTPPPVLDSPEYNVQLTAATVYGVNTSETRSDSQTNTAIFWGTEAYNTSVIAMWNRVLISALPRSISIEDSLDVFARLNVGLYDCAIVATQLKYTFNRWRPVSAVRAGSPIAEPRPSWLPLLFTPASPSYPSTSGCYAGVTSTLLQDFFGRDSVTFQVATERVGLNGVLLPSRVYQSFTQVATEVIQSRYLGGVEFPVDSAAGQDLGQNIAEYIIANKEML